MDKKQTKAKSTKVATKDTSKTTSTKAKVTKSATSEPAKTSAKSVASAKNSASSNTKASRGKKSSSRTGWMIGGIVAVIAVLALLAFLIFKMICANKTETLSCTQESSVVKSSVVYDFEGGKVNKAVLKYVWDTSVDDGNDVMAAGLALLMASKDALQKAYENEPGINFSATEEGSISTMTFEVNVKEASAEIRDKVLDDDNRETLDEIKKQLEDGGYTCTVEK